MAGIPIFRLVAIAIALGVVANQHNANSSVGKFVNAEWRGAGVAAVTGDAQYFAERFSAASDFIDSVLADGSIERDIGSVLSEYDSARIRATASPVTLKALILENESGEKGYKSYNRGSRSCAKSNKADINLTSMTIAEIQYFQALPTCTASKLLAVGHYQIVPETLNLAVNALKIPKEAKFTPGLQDRIFAFYLTQGKQPAIARYIKTGKGIENASHHMACEWAIFQSAKTGRGVYDGVGNNKARVKARRVVDALYTARQTYVRMVNDGAGEHQAYAAAVGIQ